MVNIINGKLKELKLKEMSYKVNDNKKLEEECKNILPFIIALLSSQYVKYGSSKYSYQRMIILKDIERELIKIKKKTEESRRNFIISALISNFNRTYNNAFDVLNMYKNINVTKDNISKDYLDKIIQAKFFDKTLDTRISDNTTMVMNKVYKSINTALTNKDKPLDKSIIEVTDAFNTIKVLDKRLLDTESTRIFTSAEDEVFNKFGIEQVMWCAELCPNTCSYCRGQDGEIYPINDKPIIPAHSNCNCYWQII